MTAGMEDPREWSRIPDEHYRKAEELLERVEAMHEKGWTALVLAQCATAHALLAQS